MSDFSAAAMLLLIREGLKLQGVEVVLPPPPKGAHISLTEKRALLEDLERRFGQTTLLKLGNAIHQHRSTPVLVPLALARNPVDLINRWQRLEKFGHSRHRVDIVESDERRLVLAHVARIGPIPPTSSEDLLIFGLLYSLLDLIGANGLRARPSGTRRWAAENGVWLDDLAIGKTSQWEFRWDGISDERDLCEPVADPSDWVEKARAHLAFDPGRKWTLDALAIDLGTSVRSLQRWLRQDQSSFSLLLAQTRAGEASTLLSTSDHSPAEIGYVCGYSDQAHFTRDFKRYTAFTPIGFRERFHRSVK